MVRLLVEGRVRNEDDLRDALDAHLSDVVLQQTLEGRVAASRLSDHLELALVIDDEEWLDVEDASDQRDGSGDAAALVQVAEITDGEAVTHVRNLLAEPGCIFFKRHAVCLIHGGAVCDDALPAGRGE